MTDLHIQAINTSTSGIVSTVSLKIRSKGSCKGSNGAPLAHVQRVYFWFSSVDFTSIRRRFGELGLVGG